MSYKDEKPWLIIYGFRNEEEQLDEKEYKRFCEAIKEEATYCELDDGRMLSTRFQILKPNSHYVSQEEKDRGQRKRDYWDEFQHLKKEGVLTTPEEYIEWKKQSNKDMEKYEKSLKEGDKNEKKRAT